MRKFLVISLTGAAGIAVTYFLPYGSWAELDNLPAHPLIVHGVVVLFPIFIILTLIGLVKKELLRKNHLYLIAGLAIVTIGILAAKSSGDSLAAAVGLPELHAEWGNNLVPLAMVLFASVVLYAFFSFYQNIKILSQALSVLIVLPLLLALNLVVRYHNYAIAPVVFILATQIIIFAGFVLTTKILLLSL